ncbi:hypothetical protein EVAR_3424_1 [Eumeta japonica]|uniref:Mos1 transposase HTH domain-containing protein n=1 Tax=Eumeta variegata TaxID=151549 RepID=A0A4C1SS84_EUMVA|nr:hypothetical protein EVAR_3424_1 [Eumeta japonica]
MDLTRENFRAMICYYFQRGPTQRQCIDQFTSTLENEAPSKTTVYPLVYPDFDSNPGNARAFSPGPASRTLLLLITNRVDLQELERTTRPGQKSDCGPFITMYITSCGAVYPTGAQCLGAVLELTCPAHVGCFLNVFSIHRLVSARDASSDRPLARPRGELTDLFRRRDGYSIKKNRIQTNKPDHKNVIFGKRVLVYGHSITGSAFVGTSLMQSPYLSRCDVSQRNVAVAQNRNAGRRKARSALNLRIASFANNRTSEFGALCTHRCLLKLRTRPPHLAIRNHLTIVILPVHAVVHHRDAGRPPSPRGQRPGGASPTGRRADDADDPVLRLLARRYRALHDADTRGIHVTDVDNLPTSAPRRAPSSKNIAGSGAHSSHLVVSHGFETSAYLANARDGRWQMSVLLAHSSAKCPSPAMRMRADTSASPRGIALMSSCARKGRIV